ncbi:MAG: FkbM family methyltransferase [Chitinophagaceae bacterium]|nr:MAG: FkbM family methyltransferase [Chitinophagaceae bacterium]
MKNGLLKEIAYGAYDLFTGKKGVSKRYGNVDLRLPVRYVRFFPSDYEKENAEIIAKHVKEGMTVIDIGAHIGLTSVIIARYLKSTGKIYAFEPTPTTCDVLKETIRINKLQNVIIPVQAALSDKSGKTQFYISDHSADNSNSLVNNNRRDRKESHVDVILYSLDDFMRQNDVKAAGFIKIDAEGAEFQVLKGMKETIERYAPKMILSLHPYSIKNGGDSLEEIWDLVKSHGYHVELDGRELERQEFVSKPDLFDVFLWK